jgi:3',5'-cyclic AMP phosphodiesterase CpdA
MPEMRIVQISDTHFSRGKPHFQPNWAPLKAWLIEQNPDLIIHTGDVTVDGADTEDDMVYCAALLRELPAPVLSVPGNHDVGEPGHSFQPVNEERIARWRRHFGMDRWAKDVGNWRLIGLNSMIFGSDLAEEKTQHFWLEQQLAGAAGREIGWFMHKPLFLGRRDEGDSGYWSVKPDPRAKLLDLIDQHRVNFVATGHLHKTHEARAQDCRFIWGGSSSFVVGPALQEPMPGEARLGAVVFDIDGTDIAIAHEDIPGLQTFCIDDVVHEVYPPRTGI